MAIPNLGRLEKVDLRKAWESEPDDFTPWLAQADNIEILGESIGMDLEVEAREQPVGPFRADILCKDTSSGAWVLIENQLEKTDHKHLGQLMTYAAGLDAVTVVWLAEKFTDEHRAAMDWLNRITDDKFNFFGLEIELWRIGNSAFAPKFNVVSKPNDWSRSITEAAQTLANAQDTPTKKLQQEFWTGFKEYAEGQRQLRVQKPAPQHWLNMSIGSSRGHLAAIVSSWDSETNTRGTEIRMDMVLDSALAKAHFQQLLDQKEAIEAEMGVALKWHNPEGRNACRIYLRNQMDFRNREQWQTQFKWLADHALKFRGVFADRVKDLSDSAPNPIQIPPEGGQA